MLASATSVPDFPHNAQAWSAWLSSVKTELDDVCRLLPDEDDNAFDWLRTASTTLESAWIYAKHKSMQVSKKLQRKFAPYRVTPIPKRAPQRLAAPKHEEQIEEQLVPPQLPPKREHQSKQDEASEQSAASVPDFPHNAQAWSAWLICVKKELDDVCRLLPDEDENAFDWLRTASTTLESAAIYAKCRSLQVLQKLQQKFAPYRVTPTPKRAPKRPAAPKHKEKIEDQLVPPQRQPKHDRQSKQDEAPEQSAASKQRRIKQLETAPPLVTDNDVKLDSKSFQPTVLKHEYKWQDDQVMQPSRHDWIEKLGEQEKWEETKVKQQYWSDEQAPHFCDPWADVDVQFDSQPIQPKHEYKWQDDQVMQQFIHDWTKEMGEQEKSEETKVKQQYWSDEQEKKDEQGV